MGSQREMLSGFGDSPVNAVGSSIFSSRTRTREVARKNITLPWRL
jgi:hypothetical protein